MFNRPIIYDNNFLLKNYKFSVIRLVTLILMVSIFTSCLHTRKTDVVFKNTKIESIKKKYITGLVLSTKISKLNDDWKACVVGNEICHFLNIDYQHRVKYNSNYTLPYASNLWKKSLTFMIIGIGVFIIPDAIIASLSSIDGFESKTTSIPDIKNINYNLCNKNKIGFFLKKYNIDINNIHLNIAGANDLHEKRRLDSNGCMTINHSEIKNFAQYTNMLNISIQNEFKYFINHDNNAYFMINKSVKPLLHVKLSNKDKKMSYNKLNIKVIKILKKDNISNSDLAYALSLSKLVLNNFNDSKKHDDEYKLEIILSKKKLAEILYKNGYYKESYDLSNHLLKNINKDHFIYKYIENLIKNIKNTSYELFYKKELLDFYTKVNRDSNIYLEQHDIYRKMLHDKIVYSLEKNPCSYNLINKIMKDVGKKWNVHNEDYWPWKHNFWKDIISHHERALFKCHKNTMTFEEKNALLKQSLISFSKMYKQIIKSKVYKTPKAFKDLNEVDIFFKNIKINNKSTNIAKKYLKKLTLKRMLNAHRHKHKDKYDEYDSLFISYKKYYSEHVHCEIMEKFRYMKMLDRYKRGVKTKKRCSLKGIRNNSYLRCCFPISASFDLVYRSAGWKSKYVEYCPGDVKGLFGGCYAYQIRKVYDGNCTPNSDNETGNNRICGMARVMSINNTKKYCNLMASISDYDIIIENNVRHTIRNGKYTESHYSDINAVDDTREIVKYAKGWTIDTLYKYSYPIFNSKKCSIKSIVKKKRLKNINKILIDESKMSNVVQKLVGRNRENKFTNISKGLLYARMIKLHQNDIKHKIRLAWAFHENFMIDLAKSEINQINQHLSKYPNKNISTSDLDTLRQLNDLYITVNSRSKEKAKRRDKLEEKSELDSIDIIDITDIP